MIAVFVIDFPVASRSMMVMFWLQQGQLWEKTSCFIALLFYTKHTPGKQERGSCCEGAAATAEDVGISCTVFWVLAWVDTMLLREATFSEITICRSSAALAVIKSTCTWTVCMSCSHLSDLTSGFGGFFFVYLGETELLLTYDWWPGAHS